jgi:hypothetical protein
MSRVRHTEKDFQKLGVSGEHRWRAKKKPERGDRALRESWEEAGESRYEFLALLRQRWSSADSVIQRLHSRQLRI